MSGAPRDFGARLRACRQAAGLSQQELAERSGLSVRAISDMERGRTRFPYQDSLFRLADALELRSPARNEFLSTPGRRIGPPLTSGSPLAGNGPGHGNGQLPLSHDHNQTVASPATIDDLARAILPALPGSPGTGR